MNPTLDKLKKELNKQGLDALLLSYEPNISYLCGFRSRDSYLLVSSKGSFYLTDSRYTQEAGDNLKGIGIKKLNGYFFRQIADTCISLGLKRIGFESRRLPYAEYFKIKHSLRGKAELVAIGPVVEGLRQVKQPWEIEKLRRCTDIAVKSFRFAASIIKPGLRELELVAEIERFIRYQGAYMSSFEVIAACGAHSSYPHHLSSSGKLGKDDLLLLDMGVDYCGYKSDLTRVFFSGRISKFVRKIYDIVLAAQCRAISKIRPGVGMAEIDSAARQYIRRKGYGAFFTHNTGHGLGLEVHESPNISWKSEGVLKQGMVFTVEPGIYLPKKFGIRIEDMVLVTRKGVEVISGNLDK